MCRGCEALTEKDSELLPETVSQTQLALILSLSTSRIRQLDKDNAFEKVGRGKYDLSKSIQRYIDFQVNKATAADEEFDKYKEETLYIRTRRQKSEVEYKIMTGELHRSGDIKEVMNAMLAGFRAQLLAFPTKVAPKVLPLTEIMVTKEVLKKEVYELMQELADYDANVFYERSKDKVFLDDEEVSIDEKV